MLGLGSKSLALAVALLVLLLHQQPHLPILHIFHQNVLTHPRGKALFTCSERMRFCREPRETIFRQYCRASYSARQFLASS